jgi:hypothetical protein
VGLKTVDRVLERIRTRNTKPQRAPLEKENAYSSRAALRALV